MKKTAFIISFPVGLSSGKAQENTEVHLGERFDRDLPDRIVPSQIASQQIA